MLYLELEAISHNLKLASKIGTNCQKMGVWSYVIFTDLLSVCISAPLEDAFCLAQSGPVLILL